MGGLPIRIKLNRVTSWTFFVAFESAESISLPMYPNEGVISAQYVFSHMALRVNHTCGYIGAPYRVKSIGIVLSKIMDDLVIVPGS